MSWRRWRMCSRVCLRSVSSPVFLQPSWSAGRPTSRARLPASQQWRRISRLRSSTASKPRAALGRPRNVEAFGTARDAGKAAESPGQTLAEAPEARNGRPRNVPGRLRDGPGRPGRPREAPGGPCWKPRKPAMVPGSSGKRQNFPGRLRDGPGRHREAPGGPCWKLRKPGMAPGSSGKLRNVPEGHFARPARTTSTTQVQLVPELVGRATQLVQLKN